MTLILKTLIKNTGIPPFHIQVRNSRFKPFIPIIKKSYQPELYYSLEERLQEKNEELKDPEKFKKVNIGFSISDDTKQLAREKWKIIQKIKSNVGLEKQAKDCILKVNIEDIEEEWNSSLRPIHIKSVAENYAIFKHLFGDYAFFYPVVYLRIFYNFDDEYVSPVHTGNLLKPKEAASKPTVEFNSDPESLWTLIMTNPDGNLYDNESELLHWFVGNIPGNELSKGEEIVEYMQPIPPKGTGFHRCCFVLYKQEGKLDFSEYKINNSSINLRERTFKTYNFYKIFEDALTPAGLSWFQADYDYTLSDYFRKALKMKEPIYEYEFPKQYKAPQMFFPMNRPFNRYIDLHRDPKDIQKMMLLKRLARVHPFEGEKPLLPFPQAVPIPSDVPVWIKNEIMKERDGKGKYRYMYRGDDRPYIHDGKLRRLPLTNLK